MRRTLLSLLLIAVPARADAPASVFPPQDARVVYQVSGDAWHLPSALAGSSGIPSSVTLYWDAAGRRLRAEWGSGPEVAIVDLNQRKVALLEPGLRVALSLPMSGADVDSFTLSTARFTRRGQDRVAGVACTVWSVLAKRGSGEVCQSDSGIMLRGGGTIQGRRGGFVATSVAVAPQPGTLFEPPADYHRLQLPRLQE